MKVFIDTMVFLHYRNLEEIDLLKLLDVTEVTIVLAQITLQELDKHKNDYTNKRLSERAKNAITNIDKWLTAQKLDRDSIPFTFYPNAPSDDFLKLHGLNATLNDNILIASVLKYKELNQDEDVVLITQDRAPKYTATHLGITVIQLPDELQLTGEIDPLEIENKALRQEIVKLTDRTPKLKIGLLIENKIYEFIKFNAPIDDELFNEKVAKAIQEQKEKYPYKQPQVNNETIDVRLLSVLTNIVTPEEYQRYNKDVDNYLYLYKNYLLREKYLYKINLAIENNGTIPAEDVDIELHFPDGFILWSEHKTNFIFQKPDPPIEPRTRFEIETERISNTIGGFSKSFSNNSLIDNSSAFKIIKTNSYIVKHHYKNIKHGYYTIMPELLIKFDSLDSVRSFHFEYSLYTANLPRPVSGKLHFIIE